MGKRKLKRWLLTPQRDYDIIESRLTAVDLFVNEGNLLNLFMIYIKKNKILFIFFAIVLKKI